MSSLFIEQSLKLARLVSLNGVQISALAVSKSGIEADCAGMLFELADNRGIVNKLRGFMQRFVDSLAVLCEFLMRSKSRITFLKLTRMSRCAC